MDTTIKTLEDILKKYDNIKKRIEKSIKAYTYIKNDISQNSSSEKYISTLVKQLYQWLGLDLEEINKIQEEYTNSILAADINPNKNEKPNFHKTIADLEDNLEDKLKYFENGELELTKLIAKLIQCHSTPDDDKKTYSLDLKSIQKKDAKEVCVQNLNNSRYDVILRYENNIIATFKITKVDGKAIGSLPQIVGRALKRVQKAGIEKELCLLIAILKCIGQAPICDEGLNTVLEEFIEAKRPYYHNYECLINMIDNPCKNRSIFRNLSISDFKKNGWKNITCIPASLQTSLDQKIKANLEKAEDLKEAGEIVKATALEHQFTRKLECAVKEKIPHDFEIFFPIGGTYYNAKAIKLLKILSKIKIKSLYPNNNIPDSKNLLFCNIEVEVEISPLYEICLEELNNKIVKIFQSEYCKYSSWDIKMAFGILADKIKERQSPCYFKADEFREANENLFSKDILNQIDILNQMLDHAEEYFIICKENSSDDYYFYSKWERIFLEGFAYAETNNSYCAKCISFDMINYDLPQTSDHLHYNVAAASLFAISVYKNIGNHQKKEEIISELCERANNYKAELRPQQVSALMILTYMLYTENDFSFKSKEKMFRACFLKQLYPQQVPLLKKLIERDKFFNDYSVEQFNKALKFGKNTNTMEGQPEFFLLQKLCEKEENSIDPLLKSAIEFQDGVWIDHQNYHLGGFVSDLPQKILKAILSLEAIQYSLPDIIANNLAFYAFSDLSEKIGGKAADLVKKYTNKKKHPNNWDEKSLLESIIYTDYYQRLYNPVYNQKNSIDADMQNELILLCGSSRMINSYSFNEKYSLNSDLATAYSEYLKKEDISERYFWFLVRMMLNCKVDDNDFDLESIFKEKISETFVKTDDTSLKSLKDILMAINFLNYDNFPSKDKLADVGSYEDLMNLIRTPQF